MKQFAVLLLITLLVVVTGSGSTQDASGHIEIYVEGSYQIVVNGTVVAQSEGTPTPTPTPSPTPTPVPSEPYPDAPACTDHDPNAFHSLWNEVGGCHYNHSHGNTSPHEVDDVFGEEIYGWFGGEIGYPWQTPGENEYKHNGYLWFVARDLECASSFTNGCMTDYRILAHGLATVHGNTTDTHSVWMEAVVCPEEDPTNCGIVRSGGWQGPADLVVDGERILDRENSANRVFLSYYNTGNRCCSTWYNGVQAAHTGVAIEFGDMWDTIPPGSTAEEIIAASERRPNANGSRVQMHNAFFAVPGRLLDVIGENYDGYTDRYGYLTDGCSEPGLDCVPFRVEGVPLGYQYQHRGGYEELDIIFDGASPGWIEYPTVEE